MATIEKCGICGKEGAAIKSGHDKSKVGDEYVSYHAFDGKLAKNRMKGRPPSKYHKNLSYEEAERDLGLPKGTAEYIYRIDAYKEGFIEIDVYANSKEAKESVKKLAKYVDGFKVGEGFGERNFPKKTHNKVLRFFKELPSKFK